MRTFNLFISHSWKYENSYQQLVSLLNSRSYFDYRDYSVPPANPITGARTDLELEMAIENKIRACSVVLIMAGVYSTYSKWIKKEIAIAQRLGKPIVAIKPFGAERISTEVRIASSEECNWNTESIISAIRRLA